MPCPHTAEVICDTLYKCLQSWDIDRRVSTVTLDNCSTNDSMVGLMETRLGASHMLLRGKVLHMRCCAHILNLIVKDGTQIIAESIIAIRESVAYWIATPKRYEKFEKTAMDENVKLDRAMNLDCKTRWKSTFIMLSVAISYSKVFERLGDLDRTYMCLMHDDWTFAAIVCEKLGIFYDLTMLFLGPNMLQLIFSFLKCVKLNLK